MKKRKKILLVAIIIILFVAAIAGIKIARQMSLENTIHYFAIEEDIAKSLTENDVKVKKYKDRYVLLLETKIDEYTYQKYSEWGMECDERYTTYLPYEDELYENVVKIKRENVENIRISPSVFKMKRPAKGYTSFLHPPIFMIAAKPDEHGIYETYFLGSLPELNPYFWWLFYEK